MIKDNYYVQAKKSYNNGRLTMSFLNISTLIIEKVFYFLKIMLKPRFGILKYNANQFIDCVNFNSLNKIFYTIF